MKILALNSGSSSIKYRLFDSKNDFRLLGQGLAERIGQDVSLISKAKTNQPASQEEIVLPDHRTAMQALFSHGDKADEIDAVGHRVVHGGETFTRPTLITAGVIKEIAKLAKFSPLHCEPNIIGIEALQERYPNIPHVAVFDTAAHSNITFKAFLYGISIEYYETHRIRKYGFHGINHSYVAHEAARLIGKPIDALKIITCHLGNGCSISAFEKGQSIDNSMGLSPLEGLVMGTRCGDLDPSVILYLMERFELKTEELKELLNKRSGLLGLCGKSDMRDIIAMAKRGDKLSQMAIEVFVYRIQKYIGAYVAALNGIHAIVFSGGIGENSPYIRALVMKNFSYLNARMDMGKNERNGALFSTGDSLVFLMSIPANEEMVIAKQTDEIISPHT